MGQRSTFSVPAAPRLSFGKVDPAAESWQVTSSGKSGAADTTTTEVVSEAVTVDGKVLARPKMLIAPGNTVPAETCAATPATKGCRLLEFVYPTTTTATSMAFGDFKGQVRQVRLWATAPGGSASVSTAVSEYTYDDTGRLRQARDSRINPALKTEYDYDAAGRVTSLTPPGELPWTFTYGNAGGSAAGDGMLLEATRATLQQGSKTVTDGQASTSLVYNVPLTGATAPKAMGAGDVAAWGQIDAPTDPPPSSPPTAFPRPTPEPR